MAAFYFGYIKQLVSAFGAYFSDLHVIRRKGDSVNGPALIDIRVPIAFSNRSKWYQQILEGTRDKQTKVTLPRMAFEITGFSYDSSRKASRNQAIRCKNDEGTFEVMAPVPWNIELALYIVANNQEDCLQIIEQILPQFNPDITFNLRGVFETANSVPLSLTGVSFQDDYEGSYNEARLVTYTLNFIAKMNIYGNITPADNEIENTDFGLTTDPGDDSEDITNGGTQSITKDENGNYILHRWQFDVVGKPEKDSGGKSPEVRVNHRDV